MVSTAVTDRVSRGENKEDPRTYHVFITNLLIRRSSVDRPFADLARWPDRRVESACPLEGSIGKFCRSFGTRRKPGCFHNHTSLAYFLRNIHKWNARFGCAPTRGEGSDAAGGKNTIRRAIAARYSDIVKRNAVALDVEYRSKVGKPVSGSINRVLWTRSPAGCRDAEHYPPHRACCRASCIAWSSFLEKRLCPAPNPAAPAQPSGAEHAVFITESGASATGSPATPGLSY